MKHYGKFIFALFFIFILSSMKTNSAQFDLSSGQTWGVTRTRVQHNFDEVYAAIGNTYIAALIGGNINGSLITSGTVDDSRIDTNIPRLDGIHSITGTYSFPETAYSVSTWDALSTPVTKNSFRDYMFNFDADGDGSFTDESWFPNLSGKEDADSDITKANENETITGLWAFPDASYDVSTWNAVNTPVTKNSFRDYMFNFDADGDGSFTDESWFPVGGLFDPAAPGAIGGTTPAAGTFTTVTAGEYNSSATDGERGIVFPENTTKSPGPGLEEVYNEAGVMKYSEGGVEKNFVTIDDTGGDGDTTVTLSADKIVELVTSGGSGVPDGTSTDDILSWDGDSWEPIALTAHPAFASLLTAFNNAGLNSFTFTPSVTYPRWAATSPVAVSFDVTDTSTAYSVADVDYQYDGAGGFVENMTNTTGDTWAADVTIGTDGAHTIQLEAVDDKSTPNSGQSAVYTINFDSTAPVIVAGADTTHDGSTAVTLTAALTEVNRPAVPMTYSVTNGTPSTGNMTGTYPNYSASVTPTGTGNMVATYAALDLAGNAATGTDLVQNITYSAGATNRFVWDCSTLTAGTFDATDGGTISPNSDGTPSTSFVTGHSGNGIQIASNSRVRFTATQTNNIDYSVGGMEFYYRYDSGTPSGSTYIVSANYTEPEQFMLRRSTVDNDSYAVWWAGNAYAIDTAVSIFDGSFHLVKMEWNCSTQDFDLILDGNTYHVDLSATTVPAPASTQRIYINGYSDASDTQQVTIDEVKIW